MDETVEALRRLVLGICGYLVGLTDGDAFDQLVHAADRGARTDDVVEAAASILVIGN